MKPRLLLLAFLPFLFPSFLSAVDFMEEVRPILSKNCFKCHGGPRAKKGFQMDRPDKFAEHIGPGKYIVPGDPGSSEIIHRITLPPGDADRMPPPNRGIPLTSYQVRTIETWIAQGAHLEPQSGEAMEQTAEKPDSEALHTWTSTKGTQLKAYFVKKDGDQVILRSEDGTEKPFPISVFAPQSQILIEALASP